MRERAWACIATAVTALFLGHGQTAVSVLAQQSETPPPAQAAAQPGERHLEFLAALRDNAYYEEAVYYLDQLAARDNLPAEVADALPYERARTLVAWSRATRDSRRRDELIAEARNQLDAFLQGHPEHAQANSELGELLVERGRIAVRRSKSPSQEANRAQLIAEARDYFEQARAVFEAARRRYDEEYATFPAGNLEESDPRYEQREHALANLFQARLNLALLEYEIAQTYESGSDEFRATLERAAELFREVFEQRMRTLAGQYARMWQGKCQQELGEFGRALGIYDELLGNADLQSSSDPNVRALLDRTMQFQLSCLNEQEDYEAVVDQGTAWITEVTRMRRQALNTLSGIGIRWEVARALEALGDAGEEGSEAQRNAYRDALALARAVSTIEGDYRESAQAMVRRLGALVGGPVAGPDNFDDAYSQAEGLRTTASRLRAQAEQLRARGENERADQLQTESDEKLEESRRLFTLALRLAGPTTGIDQINQARLRLALVNYEGGRPFEAAVLAGHVGQRYADTDLGLNASYVALAAFNRAFNDAREGPSRDTLREAAMRHMVELAEHMNRHWPRRNESEQAWLLLGDVARFAGDPVAAADWFGRVSENSPNYPEAQSRAGQAYWSAYTRAGELREDERPTPDELAEFRRRAQEHLENGIRRLEESLAAGQPPTRELLLAKLSLAQICAQSGDYERARELLTAEPLGVLPQIESDREDLNRGNFRQVAYTTALRTYVGLEQVDEARAVMERLNELAADPAQLVGIYMQLGRSLREQVETLRANREDERLVEVLNSFESFLDDMLAPAANADVPVLTWIGETFYGLADGNAPEWPAAGGAPSAEQREQARRFFEKAAAAYRRVVERAEADPQQEADQFRTRLVAALRRQGQLESDARRAEQCFREARQQVIAALRGNRNSLPAQWEAARLYQAWGRIDRDQYQRALTGVQATIDGERTRFIWGLGYLAELLRANEGASAGSRFYDDWHEARLRIAQCEFLYGQSQQQPGERTSRAARAYEHLRLTYQTSPDMGGETWRPRFEQLTREIQQVLNPNAPARGLAAFEQDDSVADR